MSLNNWQDWFEKRVEQSKRMSNARQRAHQSIVNKAEGYRVLLGLNTKTVKELIFQMELDRSNYQDGIDNAKRSIPRRVSTKEEAERVNEKIRNLNEKTQAFNDKYREYELMLRYVLQYKQDGEKRMLLDNLNYSMGIPFPIQTYIKEAGQ